VLVHYSETFVRKRAKPAPKKGSQKSLEIGRAAAQRWCEAQAESNFFADPPLRAATAF
jgi:hypothetical protein